MEENKHSCSCGTSNDACCSDAATEKKCDCNGECSGDCSCGSDCDCGEKSESK